MSLRKIFAETVTNQAKVDTRVVTIVGDISHGIFSEMRRSSPDRYFNIGICEPGMVSIAAGLASQGLIPVVHTIAPFLIERSYEQLKLDFSYQKLGGNFISVGGAFEYSKLGCTHHCYTDYSLISKLPNAQVFFPGSEEEFKILFLENYDNGLLNYFRLTEFTHDVSVTGKIRSGKAVKLRTGEQITIAVCGGAALSRAYEAVRALETCGIDAELLYFHTLRPLDVEVARESVRKTRRLLVVEENFESDGLFTSILTEIRGEFIYQATNLAISDFVRDYGSYEYLVDQAGLSAQDIIQTSVKLMNDRR
jgi:transketolase